MLNEIKENNNKEQKFYNKKWFIWLMLVFIAPVGIFLMYRNKMYDKPVRIVLSVIFSIVFIIAIVPKEPKEQASNNNKTENVKQEPVKVKEEPVKKKEEPPFDFAKLPITEENVKKALEKTIDKDSLKGIVINNEKGKNIIDVTYKVETAFSETALVKGFANTSVKVMEILFKNPKADKVWVWCDATMTDAKGNNSKIPVLNVCVTKENAKDINWSNFKGLVKSDYNNLFNVADKHFIHPAIAKNLK